MQHRHVQSGKSKLGVQTLLVSGNSGNQMCGVIIGVATITVFAGV